MTSSTDPIPLRVAPAAVALTRARAFSDPLAESEIKRDSRPDGMKIRENRPPAKEKIGMAGFMVISD